MKRIKTSGFVLFAIVLVVVCSSWGFLMHRTQSQLAVYQLPTEMKPFFYQNIDYLVRQSVRPDERRSKDSTEASKHFIDLEAFGANAAYTMPMDWKSAVKKYSLDTLLEYGYVPYWVVEMKNRLTGAFRKGSRDSILFYAADLSHYIQDAHVPLHTTLNYDGQLTNQKGMHSLWESTVPELSLETFDLKAHKKAGYVKDPAAAIWKAIRAANKLVPAVLETEKAVSVGFTDSTKYRIQMRNGRESKSYSTAFVKAYGKILQKSINAQAKRSANLVADFWYTAWVDAGRPDLQPIMTRQLKDEEKLTLEAETKAYRKNELLKKGWLLSKKDVRE